MFLFGCSVRPGKKRASVISRVRTWVCVYDARVNPADVARFDLAVLDSDSHPDLEKLQESRTVLLGYVSLAEVGDYRWYWEKVSSEPWVLEKNPNWNSYMIDVRQKAWQDLLLDQVIPSILAKGFDGLFLDTIDTAEYLEKYHPNATYPGAEAAMVQLIRRIRKKYPDIFLVANRGFDMLEQIGRSIDAVVAESVFTRIDFENDTTYVQSAPGYQAQLERLERARKKFGIGVLTLDYFKNQADRRIFDVIRLSRSYEFVPFVSTTNLDRIYFHTVKE